MADYVTLQAILEEAGLQHVVLGEEAIGTVDGSNKVFTAQYKPLADTDYSDSVTTADVAVYVNGIPVAVASVDAATGAVTLASAPSVGQKVTIDYRYSAMSLTAVGMVREEAQDWIDTEMNGTDDVPYNVVPPRIRLICRVFCAGLLLAKDYGFNHDTENTSKDGTARIRQAEKWLQDYKAKGGYASSSSNTQIEDIEVESSGDIFAASLPDDESVSDNDFLLNLE